MKILIKIFSECSKITDSGAQELALSIKQLQKLKLLAIAFE